MTTITFNKDVYVGKTKPMHAVNNVPSASCRGEETGEYLKLYKEAGIPFCRYHDTGGPFGRNIYVDIGNVFRDFDADETKSENYDFVFTDWLINRCLQYDVKPFYRLGTTIENDAFIKPYRILPPKDYKKWARICEHIIMHYNEGWADGFYHNIEYWEIWNEPDNGENIQFNQMWYGTKEQFYELYEVASNHLKNRFPNLKIGGYSSCGFYKAAEVAVDPYANVSEDFNYFFDFFHGFMKHITSKGHESPMDFFSWHSYYSSPSKNAIMSNYVREQLDHYGYPNCENICNEWNPGPGKRGQLCDGARIASNMISWHKNNLDMAMYYNMRLLSSYCGPLNPVTGKIFKAYYAFKAFDMIYKLEKEVQTDVDNQDIQVLGASNGQISRIMLSNFEESEKQSIINLCGYCPKTAKIFRSDADGNFEEETLDVRGDKIDLTIKAFAVYVIELQ